ncbi:MAG: hypothetical protein AAB443_04265 [Patescibacteria group bacterium]
MLPFGIKNDLRQQVRELLNLGGGFRTVEYRVLAFHFWGLTFRTVRYKVSVSEVEPGADPFDDEVKRYIWGKAVDAQSGISYAYEVILIRIDDTWHSPS